MHEDFILRQVRRCNKNLLLVNLFVFFAVLLIAYSSYNYFYNFFLGPFTLDAAAIEGHEALKKDYITVQGVENAHTGLQYIETSYEEGTNKVIDTKVLSDYVYLTLDNKLLVVKAAPGNATALSHTGILKKIPADIRQQLYSAAEEEISLEEFNLLVLPFMLDTQVSRAGGYFGLLTCVPLFLISAWNLLKYGKRISDPFGHPIYKKLRIHGEPESVAKNIDEDIAGSGIPITKHLVISNGWLVKETFFGLIVVPLQDVLWIYKHITQQRVNFIPVGKIYSLAIHLKNKSKVQVGMSEKNVDAVAQVMHSKAPGIVCGYSDTLAALWKKNYPAFVAAIEKYKNAV